MVSGRLHGVRRGCRGLALPSLPCTPTLPTVKPTGSVCGPSWESDWSHARVGSGDRARRAPVRDWGKGPDTSWPEGLPGRRPDGEAGGVVARRWSADGGALVVQRARCCADGAAVSEMCRGQSAEGGAARAVVPGYGERPARCGQRLPPSRWRPPLRLPTRYPRLRLPPLVSPPPPPSPSPPPSGSLPPGRTPSSIPMVSRGLRMRARSRWETWV